jgi:2-desacetyl-2-hydroxyethyl bacteriochlorophyllide A dehydrogenase
MPSELLLTAPRALRIVRYDDPVLGTDAVRAKAVASGISHGTELALYRGDSPFGRKRFDLDLRQFVAAAETELYPMRMGYEWVGRVDAVGADVRGLEVGEHVHLTLPHRETHTFATGDGPAAPWLVLPREVEPERAVFVQSAAIALQAIRDARLDVGDRVAIFGLGVLGLLAVQFARLNGAGWVAAVDPIPARRKLAGRFGADCTLDPNTSDAGLEIKLASGRGGPDVAIEFSGRYAALHEALRCVRVAGAVVAAGFYVGSAGPDLRLGEEFHHNRLTLVGSMSGWGAPQREPGWDRRRLRETALDLIAKGRLDVDAFITHRFPFERATEAYELIDGRPEDTLRVVLTY